MADLLSSKTPAKLKPLQFKRVGGLALASSKGGKVSLAILDYFVKEQRIVLTHVEPHFVNSQASIDSETPNVKMTKWIEKDPKIQSLHINAPLKQPVCNTCKLKCPGDDVCSVPEIKWMREFYEDHTKSKKPKKHLAGYLERSCDLYLRQYFDCRFEIDPAFGSKKGPLWARANYLKKQFSELPLYEFEPQLSLEGMSKSLSLKKSDVACYKRSSTGQDMRIKILPKIVKKMNLFMYEEDRLLLEKNSLCFDALLGALTGLARIKKELIQKPSVFKKNKIYFPDVLMTSS